MPSSEPPIADDVDRDVPSPPGVFAAAAASMSPMPHSPGNQYTPYQPRPAPSVCYFYGTEGHVSRFCHRRHLDQRSHGQPGRSPEPSQFRSRYYASNRCKNHRSSDYTDDYSPSRGYNTGSFRLSRLRSPTSYPHRSPIHASPTRSRSPARLEN